MVALIAEALLLTGKEKVLADWQQDLDIRPRVWLKIVEKVSYPSRGFAPLAIRANERLLK